MGRIGLGKDFNPATEGKMYPLAGPGQEEAGGKKIWLNPMQLQAYNFGSRVLLIRAGRGTGKTTILGLRLTNCVQTIPRSTGLFLGNSIKQLYIRTLPNTTKSIEMLTGMKEGLHFFRGHAPKSAKFIDPFTRPRIWENVVHFYNGAVVMACSLGVTGSANSINAAYLIADECKFLNMKKLQSEVLPSLRGDSYPHPGWRASGTLQNPGNPYYLSQTYVSDAGVTAREKEWEKEKENQTDEINGEIAQMLAELNLCPELATAPRFINRLNHLRCQSRVYFNFSSVENLSMLGEEYMDTMRRQMPDLLFRVQILGEDLTATKDGFYYNFDETLHCYVTKDDDDMQMLHSKFLVKYKKEIFDSKAGITRKVDYEAIDLEATAGVDDCTLDSDLQWDEPLWMAPDVGANLSCMVVGQVRRMDGVDTLVVLKTFFVKNQEKVETLCRNVLRYYAPKLRAGCRDCFLVTDSTMRQGQSYATELNESTRYDRVMIECLSGGKRGSGFKVYEKHIGQPMQHMARYRFINSLFSGEGKMMIRINHEQNEFLIAALQAALVKVTKNAKGETAIKKDKSREKYSAELTAGQKETRTDVTDAFDLLCCGVRFNKGGMRSGGFAGLAFSTPRTM